MGCKIDLIMGNNFIQYKYMNRIMSKKLQIDQNNDSLLEQPIMKKFIGVSRKIEINPMILSAKQKLNIKYLEPQVDLAKSTIRRRIISMSPSQTRISFFTKYNQSRLLETKNISNPQSSKLSRKVNSQSKRQPSKIVIKSFESPTPKLNFIKRRLSIGTLKPKAEVEKEMMWRRKNLDDNPFRSRLRESDYL